MNVCHLVTVCLYAVDPERPRIRYIWLTFDITWTCWILVLICVWPTKLVRASSRCRRCSWNDELYTRMSSIHTITLFHKYDENQRSIWCMLCWNIWGDNVVSRDSTFHLYTPVYCIVSVTVLLSWCVVCVVCVQHWCLWKWLCLRCRCPVRLQLLN